MARTAAQIKHKESGKETARRRIYQNEVRAKVLRHYGGNPPRCACCGESVPKFLCLDHINNDGNKHRKAVLGKNKGGWMLYIQILRDLPTDLQVLCYNCNLGKARNGGVCPHREHSN